MSSPASSPGVDRRDFVKTLSAAGVGLALGALPETMAQTASLRRRYAIVGCGSRHQMYQDAIEGEYRPHAQLVGLCDVNPGRIELARQHSAANGAAPAPGYAAADFDRMIAETKPDFVIVTSVDATHADYLVRALEAGCDVITEKPLTTTAAMCQRILDARRRSGRHLRVTFNYRYSPPRTQVKDILMSGEIGDVLSVDFHWMLNTSHGTDYFRRWHSRKANSGGLMIHKASHHFDLVNWWLGAVPVSVYATGKREFYTPAMARRFGLESHHERCRTCPEKSQCGFFFYHIVFNGTKGRLEHTIVESTYVNGTDTIQGGIAENGVTTRVIPLRGAARRVEPWTGSGGHGGGDKVMLDEIFLPEAPADKYLRASNEHAGACSILVGVAANECFRTGQPVKIADLVTGLERPAYSPMPSRTGPLPMPDPNARRI